MKRQIAFITLIAILLALIATPLSVYALVDENEEQVALLQEGDYDIVEAHDISFYASNPTSYQQASDYIYQQLLAYSDSISLILYRIPSDDFGNLYANVINDHPDLFFVSSNLHYYTSSISGKVTEVIPDYAMTQSETEEALELFNAGVQRTVSCIDSSMTELQKALVLHDYVCDIAHYPDLSQGDLAIYHSAYGFFYDTNIVCAGYALVYSYLMNYVGVETEYVSSFDMSHAWNKVKIGSEWYNADLTWDDLDYGISVSLRGSMQHSLFIKSDSYFESPSGMYHYGGTTFDDTESTDTAYDSYFWDNVTSRICVLDSAYYYINPTTYYLVERQADGTEANIGNPIPGVTLTGSKVVTDSNGNEQIVTFPDFLGKLVYLDGRFYISSYKSVYSLTLDASKRSIISFSDYGMGFGVDDSGNLVYQLYSTPDSTVTLDKLEYFHTYMTKPGSNAYNNYPDINYDDYINAKDFAMITRQ